MSLLAAADAIAYAFASGGPASHWEWTAPSPCTCSPLLLGLVLTAGLAIGCCCGLGRGACASALLLWGPRVAKGSEQEEEARGLAAVARRLREYKRACLTRRRSLCSLEVSALDCR